MSSPITIIVTQQKPDTRRGEEDREHWAGITMTSWPRPLSLDHDGRCAGGHLSIWRHVTHYLDISKVQAVTPGPGWGAASPEVVITVTVITGASCVTAPPGHLMSVSRLLLVRAGASGWLGLSSSLQLIPGGPGRHPPHTGQHSVNTRIKIPSTARVWLEITPNRDFHISHCSCSLLTIWF